MVSRLMSLLVEGSPARWIIVVVEAVQWKIRAPSSYYTLTLALNVRD